MKSDRNLVAHLMRRGGFGAIAIELDHLTSKKSYEDIVDDLVNPERLTEIEDDLIDRYYSGEGIASYVGKWLYRMINSTNPLQEKMTLFLHQISPRLECKQRYLIYYRKLRLRSLLYQVKSLYLL